MIDGVQSFVASGHEGVRLVAHVGVPMGHEDTGHVVVVEQYHEGRHHEEEPGDTHPGVDQDGGRFVLLIHLLFVVNVVGPHF